MPSFDAPGLEQRQDRHRISRRERAETGEKDGHPGNYHDKKRRWNRPALLHEQKPACLSDVGARLKRLGLERSLRIRLRLQFFDIVKEPFVATLRSTCG